MEDAAQAVGSTLAGRSAGTLGTLATFSFFPSKNLGCFGDGGAVVTDAAALADRIRQLRFHGSRDKVTFELIGYNSRLDELQAAILRVQLAASHAWAEGRREAGRHYETAGLGELVSLPAPGEGADPAWHLYVIRHPQADALADALGRATSAAGLLPAAGAQAGRMASPTAGGPALPATDRVAAEHLAIPMSPFSPRPQSTRSSRSCGPRSPACASGSI